MSDQNSSPQDDTFITNYFKDIERMPPIDKQTLDWSVLTEFPVYRDYLIQDIKEIEDRLHSADDEYLYYVCEHLFNLLDWINLMVFDAGYPSFATHIEDALEKNFGDRKILHNIYNNCFEKWLSKKNGQQKVGENFYHILESKIYYRDHLKRWFEIDKKTAFDLQPKKQLIENEEIINQLNNEYQETKYDNILKSWQDKQYSGTLTDDFLRFDSTETNPEEYFNFSIEHIKRLLQGPVSIKELERWNGGEIEDLDYMVKLSTLILETVNKRRGDNVHTLYLLRDCLIFYELHKTLDILDLTQTSSDQVLIGRKLLSLKSQEWGYYIATLEALYTSHLRYPTNFEEFYKEYSRLLDIFVSLNLGFAKVVSNLANYIKDHIQTDKNKIVIFDIGFQGSIALLTKYIIDHHINPTEKGSEIKTDIKTEVGALWSKELFGDRYEGFYFPYLNRVQLITRNNDLYYYKLGSLNEGKVKVLMGDKENQQKAAIELVILLMITLSSKNT